MCFQCLGLQLPTWPCGAFAGSQFINDPLKMELFRVRYFYV